VTFCIFAALGLWCKRLKPIHLIFVFFYTAVLHNYLSRADSPLAAPLSALEGLMFLPLLAPANSEADGNPSRMTQRGAVFAALLAGIFLYGGNADSIPAPYDIVRGAKLVASWIRNPKLSDSERIQGSIGGDWPSVFSLPNPFQEGELDAVKYVASQTGSSDRIFIGAKDNSTVYANDIRLYWLTGRLPGVRYYELDAGVASTAGAQERIILDLEQNRVNWAILQDEEGWGDESFLAKVHAESRRLDDFLRGQFREVERFGRFSVLKRR
jgi:hypothetical protein